MNDSERQEKYQYAKGLNNNGNKQIKVPSYIIM